MTPHLTRRHLVAGGLGSLAWVGCARPPVGRRGSLVSIGRAAGYTHELYDLVRRILAEHKLDARGKRVVLKPNLVEFDPGAAINTHPLLVHAALEAFVALGASEVRIAEGPGHRRGTLDLADAAGYFATVPRFENRFTDLNLDDVSKVALDRPASKLKSLYLPNTVLGCDLLVSMPKMKTHHWVGATLSMKNLFGVVPGAVYGWPKNVLHWAGINECIVDLTATFPRCFAIVDGIVGMEGNGPIQGKPKPAGVLVAGSDLAAVDATCCRIMRIDAKRIEYLRLLSRAIRQIGEPIEKVQTSFELIPEFRAIRLEN